MRFEFHEILQNKLQKKMFKAKNRGSNGRLRLKTDVFRLKNEHFIN